jgi:hypothetical protein
MEEKTLRALHWIVPILNKHSIPYRIGGGLAASVYGSPRKVNDIDISLSGRFFPVIIPEAINYITIGPKHYLTEKWDCDTLSLNFYGQEVDMTDVDTLRMSNKEKTKWIKSRDAYYLFDPVIMKVDGIDVSLFHPRDLIAYKKELDGAHQLVDIKAIQEYIIESKL